MSGATGPLPSVKQLQQEHDVGRDTVPRAIDMLRSEGLVFRDRSGLLSYTGPGGLASAPLAWPLVDPACSRVADRVGQKRVTQIVSGDREGTSDE